MSEAGDWILELRGFWDGCHWYASLKDPSGKGHDVEYPLTVEQAQALNDCTDAGYECGEMSKRFFSEEEAVAVAIEEFGRLKRHGDLLLDDLFLEPVKQPTDGEPTP